MRNQKLADGGLPANDGTRAMFPLFDNQPHTRFPAVTATLVAANLAAFAHQIYLGWQGGGEAAALIYHHALIPSRLMTEPGRDTFLTVFTSMFLHGGWLHLLANLWFLCLFGNAVEHRLGAVRFVLLYALAGAGAAFAQFIVNPFSPIPMIGASGAIAGILGAYLFLFPTALIITLTPIWFAPILPVPAVVFLILWFLFQFWQGFHSLFDGATAGGVAWWAHLGGFAAGFLIVRTMNVRKGKH